MNIAMHQIAGISIAEIVSDNILLSTPEDATDLIGSLYFHDTSKVVIREKNITPEFFDLKRGLAGEILQKCSNYHLQLAIVGDFSPYTGKSIRDFIYESNKRGQINFVASLEEALQTLSRK
jgi:hypothetical protein